MLPSVRRRGACVRSRIDLACLTINERCSSFEQNTEHCITDTSPLMLSVIIRTSTLHVEACMHVPCPYLAIKQRGLDGREGRRKRSAPDGAWCGLVSPLHTQILLVCITQWQFTIISCTLVNNESFCLCSIRNCTRRLSSFKLRERIYARLPTWITCSFT
jgi:hypothetical protein